MFTSSGIGVTPHMEHLDMVWTGQSGLEKDSWNGDHWTYLPVSNQGR